jgi:outer membrane protein assembly factor BamB
VGVLALLAAGNDWPVFRGNALQTGAVKSALPETLEPLWTFPTKDSIESAPAVADGVVYVASQDEHLYAVDLMTGKEKWRYKAGPFKPAPSVHDGAVYVGDSDGLFHCVDAATGKKRWTFETGAEIISGANFAGDLVLFGSYDQTLYCLTREGKKKWAFKTNGPINGSPAVAQGHTFVAGCDSSVHVIDLATAKEVTAVDLGGQAAATAAVVGDKLFVGTMTNQVLGVDWKQGKIIWNFAPARRAQAFFASAALADNLVVVGSRDKRLYALEQKDGSEKWNFATLGHVDASPVIAGSRVYAGSLDGKLYVLDLATGKQVQKIELDGPVTGSPAVAQNRLLIGTGKGTLYCFGAKK